MGETAPAATPSPSPPLPPTPPLPPGRLTVIGVGHVFRIEDAVREAIAALRPDVVFVELDRGRLEALLARRRGDKMPEGEGFWQKRLQRFQEGVAGLYGAQPGAEMVAAVEGARAVGARVLLIDPPAQDTVRRALRALTWRERLRAARMAAGGLLRSLWPSRGARAAIEAEIKRYQEDPEAALEELRRTFPTLHRIVIAERDELMARRIRRHLAGAAHGVAVLGDGHVGGILRSLAGLDVTAYRLRDVREGRLPRAPLATGDTNRVTFGFHATTGGPPQGL